MSTTSGMGKVLASAPIGSIVRDLALAIADAQRDLDASSIAATKAMASESVTVTDAGGESHDRTLLSMGFAPTFYTFAAVDIEVSVDVRIEESSEAGVSGSIEASREGSTAVGMALSAEYQRKFGMESSGSTRISAQLVSLPPPSVFLDLLQGLGGEGE